MDQKYWRQDREFRNYELQRFEVLDWYEGLSDAGNTGADLSAILS